MGLLVKGIRASGPYRLEPIIYSILFCAILFYSTLTTELSPHTKIFSTLFLLF